mmetsp:Transcript_3595/g.14512  ORF Transcript_3595/g.14512 Transcript_3595/m.14512 type:complete len:290 (-) Transcript_3595:255-1124(-)
MRTMRPMKRMHVSPGSTSMSTEEMGVGCTPLRARVRARQHTVRSTRPAVFSSSGLSGFSGSRGSRAERAPLPSEFLPFASSSRSSGKEGELGADAVAATSESESSSLASASRSAAICCAYWISRPRLFRSASESGLDAFATRSRYASVSVTRRFLRRVLRCSKLASSSSLSGDESARRLRLASVRSAAPLLGPGGFIQLNPSLCALIPSLCRPPMTGSGRPEIEPRGMIIGRLARGAAATREWMSRCFCVVLGRTNSEPRACRRAMSASSSRRSTCDALKSDSLDPSVS